MGGLEHPIWQAPTAANPPPRIATAELTVPHPPRRSVAAATTVSQLELPATLTRATPETKAEATAPSASDKATHHALRADQLVRPPAQWAHTLHPRAQHQDSARCPR
eukprot:14152425-Alexandrium_andersonii.AAC.1